MRRTTHHLLFALLALWLAGLAGCATSPEPAPAPLPKPRPDVVHINEADRALIRDYYRRHPIPASLKEVTALPPALAEQIQPKGTLPPGVGFGLPRALERHMSPLPAGRIRLRVGLDIVLVDLGTQHILDVVKDISP